MAGAGKAMPEWTKRMNVASLRAQLPRSSMRPASAPPENPWIPIIVRNCREVGDYFRARLEDLRTKHVFIREIRGLGLMLGMELDSAETAKAVVQQLLQKGILINRTQETVLRFLPPYIIQKKHVDEVVRTLDSALSASATKRPPMRAAKTTKRSLR